MTLTYGSLFAGVGGFDSGMELAGYEPVFQVEWDKNCQKILHHHWPTVPKWGDVCDVNGADLPPCDVLIFGSPCQDLSVAGKRAGLQDGDRSSMFFEAVRIIKEMRDATNSIYPRATIWENVPGALSSNKGADFGVVLSSMADIGAITQEYAVLDAQYFGVPQRRRRIFLVSIFDPAASERCPDPLLPVIQGSRGDFAKGRKARKDAARLAEESIDSSNEQTIGALCARDYKGVGNQYVAENKLVIENKIKQINMPISELGPTLATTYGAKNYSNHQEVMSGSIIPVAYLIREDAKANNFSATETDFDTQFGSNAAVFEDQSPTLKSTQQPPSVSPPGLAVRRLTPLECERLMGWPDDHTRWTADGKEQADTNRYKQCGNGVATPVAAWVAKNIKAIL